MSGVSKKLMGTTAAGGGQIDISDYFSTYLYTGNGSTQTITNGIDLAGEGGLVWIKQREVSYVHLLTDSTMTRGQRLDSSTNDPITNNAPYNVTSFNSDGFSLSDVAAGSYGVNGAPGGSQSGTTAGYASWTFRKAPRFFDVVAYSGSSSTSTVYNHNLGIVPGCIIIKTLNANDPWYVYHRGLPNGLGTGRLFLNTTNSVDNSTLQFLSVTDSTFSFDNSAGGNYSGNTYVAYLFAHDPLGPSEDGSDGLIACGSFSGEQEIDLGWEAGWVLTKGASLATDWYMQDNMRGFFADTTGKGLAPNRPDGELNSGIQRVSATGFKTSSSWAGVNGIYIAIRRGPMRVPESGTEVFATASRTTATPSFAASFPVVDATLIKNVTSVSSPALYSRLTGNEMLQTASTAAEADNVDFKQDYMNGVNFFNAETPSFRTWMFRRAPNFFDVVAYTGTGVANTTIKHNLKTIPEMIILKDRADSQSWVVYHKDVGNSNVLLLNLDFAALDSNNFNDQTPTNTEFYLGGPNTFGNYANPNIAYLFATLAGVSKVGSYTGNGSSQTIDCGFTTGARFILIKRTDSTGDWYVWDTARGIVTGNDPHLSLNTTAAEVTSDDSIDPASSGFIVNQVAATNINVSAASYIFYAVS